MGAGGMPDGQQVAHQLALHPGPGGQRVGCAGASSAAPAPRLLGRERRGGGQVLARSAAIRGGRGSSSLHRSVGVVGRCRLDVGCCRLDVEGCGSTPGLHTSEFTLHPSARSGGRGGHGRRIPFPHPTFPHFHILRSAFSSSILEAPETHRTLRQVPGPGSEGRPPSGGGGAGVVAGHAVASVPTATHGKL